MRKIILKALLSLSVIANAQTPWTGTALTGNSYRTGNVGIGLSSPTTLLDVNGGFSHFVYNTASLPPSDPYGGLTVGWNRMGGGNAEVNFYNVYNNSPTSFLFSQKTAAGTMVDLMAIKGNGYVGIGLNAPERQLHVFGTGDAHLRLQGSGGANSQKWDLLSSGGSALLNSGYFGVIDVNDNVSRFVIDNDGRIGIGLNIPEKQMHIKAANDVSLRLESAINAGQKWDLLSSGGGFLNSGFFGIMDVDANSARMTINNSGNVGIGMNDAGNYNLAVAGKTRIGTLAPTGAHTDAMLSVDGKMVSKSMYVTQLNWADFVFDKDYQLPKLAEIEAYYKVNGHLPLIPTAAEVKENGIDLGEMNKLLLQKIEELTILMVEQQKEIEAIKKSL